MKQRSLRWFFLTLCLLLVALIRDGRHLDQMLKELEGDTTSLAWLSATKKTPCPPSNITWKVILAANAAYEEDLLNWWYFCFTQSHFCSCHVSEIVLYAEDNALYERYQHAQRLRVEAPHSLHNTRYQNTALLGQGRFEYNNKDEHGLGFREMMSRRPSIVVQELNRSLFNLQQEQQPPMNHQEEMILFSDLDVFLLQNPQPYLEEHLAHPSNTVELSKQQQWSIVGSLYQPE